MSDKNFYNKNLIDEILKLKKEKNAIILAHNYQRPEIQDIADFVGDSLGLSIQASETDKDIIIFCGVDFMAETAKILNPSKKVILPEKAFCPMAMMLSPEDIINLKKKFPNAPVVLYVNTLASCKALADYCCASGNAIKVVNSIDSNEIIFGPDKNLADYVQKHTNKKIIPVHEFGYCPTHHQISVNDVIYAKNKYKNALFIAHPETTQEVQKYADYVGSTEQLVEFVKNCDNKEFIIGTENGIIHRLYKETKGEDKKFYPVSEMTICPNMKMITLESVYRALKDEIYEIILNEEILEKARLAIERMIKII
ncbi:MAG: quinolinate synthase NadA [Candidatus Altarchaeaceae archaeon]